MNKLLLLVTLLAFLPGVGFAVDEGPTNGYDHWYYELPSYRDEWESSGPIRTAEAYINNGIHRCIIFGYNDSFPADANVVSHHIGSGFTTWDQTVFDSDVEGLPGTDEYSISDIRCVNALNGDTYMAVMIDNRDHHTACVYESWLFVYRLELVSTTPTWVKKARINLPHPDCPCGGSTNELIDLYGSPYPLRLLPTSNGCSVIFPGSIHYYDLPNCRDGMGEGTAFYKLDFGPSYQSPRNLAVSDILVHGSNLHVNKTQYTWDAVQTSNGQHLIYQTNSGTSYAVRDLHVGVGNNSVYSFTSSVGPALLQAGSNYSDGYVLIDVPTLPADTYRVYKVSGGNWNITMPGYNSSFDISNSDLLILPEGRPMIIAQMDEGVVAFTPESLSANTPLWLGTNKSTVGNTLMPVEYDLVEYPGITSSGMLNGYSLLTVNRVTLPGFYTDFDSLSPIYNPGTTPGEKSNSFLIRLYDADNHTKQFVLIMRQATRNISLPISSSPNVTVNGSNPWTYPNAPNDPPSDPEHLYRWEFDISNQVSSSGDQFRFRASDKLLAPDYWDLKDANWLIFQDYVSSWGASPRTFYLYAPQVPLVNNGSFYTDVYGTGRFDLSNVVYDNPTSVLISSTASIGVWNFNSSFGGWTWPPYAGSFSGGAFAYSFSPPSGNPSGTFSISLDHNGFIGVGGPALDLSPGAYRVTMRCKFDSFSNMSESPEISFRLSSLGVRGYDSRAHLYHESGLTGTNGEFHPKVFYLTVPQQSTGTEVLALDVLDFNTPAAGTPQWELIVDEIRLDKLNL